MEDSCLVKELGVNPDFLDQVKDFLDKPVDPDILGQVPPTVSNLQVHISKQESTSSNSSDSNSPDSNPTLPGSPEVPTDTSGHSTSVGATASAPAGAPPETIKLRVCWEDQVGGLIDRKMLYGLGPKSVISILEKVVFYLKKLRWIASLPPQETTSSLPQVYFPKRLPQDYLKTTSRLPQVYLKTTSRLPQV